MPGLYLSASWSKTEYENLISSLYAGLGRSYVYALVNWQQFPDQVRRDANGVLTYVADRQSFNLSGRASEAVDFVVRYTFDTAMGEFAAGILGTRTLKLETALAGTDPIAQEGTNQGPVKMKGSAYLDWARGDWGANLTINHASSYENISSGARRTDVDGYTTVDLQGTYTLPESGWRITAGVQNILDADFPFFDGFHGVHSVHVDFRRRVAFVDIVKEFSW
jgi:outer membrane receptor protein involved in Fe transport